jgi:hypothetical protein
MPPANATVDLVETAFSSHSLHYEIGHLWNGDPIPVSPDHKINAQISLQSKTASLFIEICSLNRLMHILARSKYLSYC